LFIGTRKVKDGKVLISPQMQKDLQLWRAIVLVKNRVYPLVSRSVAEFFPITDASTTGLGGWLFRPGVDPCASPWFQLDIDLEACREIFGYAWNPKRTPQKVIAALECVAQLIAMTIWGADLGNREVTVNVKSFTDSNVCVLSGRKWYARREPLVSVLRALAFVGDTFNVAINMSHIPGKINVRADDISRRYYSDMDPTKRIHITISEVANMIRSPLGYNILV
jgi:hypothetical protein